VHVDRAGHLVKSYFVSDTLLYNTTDLGIDASGDVWISANAPSPNGAGETLNATAPYIGVYAGLANRGAAASTFLDDLYVDRDPAASAACLTSDVVIERRPDAKTTAISCADARH
jgi:hypothetical protein